MLATEYAGWYDIAPQGENESDTAFRNRVSGELRSLGHVIEVHEVAQNKRYDETGGDMVMLGIAGALAMAMQGVSYGSTGSNLVGDEIAAGIVATSPKRNEDPLMLMLALLMAK
jgi:hypothetical protein